MEISTWGNWRPDPVSPHLQRPPERFQVRYRGLDVTGAQFSTAADAWRFVDSVPSLRHTVWDTVSKSEAPRPAQGWAARALAG